MTISIAAGICVGLVASVVQSLGMTIQRKSHVQHSDLPVYRRPLWLLGLAIFLASNILGSLFQIASLPVLILAPLGAVSLLWNALFAHLILRDVFSLWLVFGTIFIAGGAVLIAVFGIVPEPTHSLDDLILLFRRPAFITYFTLLGAAVVAALAITHITELSLGRRLRLTPPPTPPTPSTPLPSATEHTPLLNGHPKDIPEPQPESIASSAIEHTRLLLAVSYSSASGIISGMCLLFAKSGVELLVLTFIEHKNQFFRVESWLLLVGLVVFALLQLWYLHKSLVLADPTLVCPLAFCFYNVSSIVNSLVYYDQFALLSTTHLLLVVLGTIVLLAGVWSISTTAGGNKGIDVGTFHEGEATAEEMAVVDFADEVNDGRLPDRSTVSVPRRLPSDIERVRRHRRSVTSPIRSTDALSEIIEQDEGSQFARSPERIEEGEVSRPGPEPLSSQGPTSPRSTMHRRHRSRKYSFLSPSHLPSHPPNTHTPQSSARTSLIPSGGFSIGLSPISPGFAVVPQRTIRMMTLRGVVGQLRMRRTLSEGDVRSDLGDLNPAGGLEEGRGVDGVRGLGEEEMLNGEGSSDKRAKVRWKWVRSLVRKGDEE